MDEHQIQQRHKWLQFPYSEFQKKNKNLENWKLDKFYIFEQIGEGGSGQIYRGMNGQTKKQVAIKVLDIRTTQKQTNIPIKLIKKRLIQQESKLMMKINSSNVLKCFQCFSNKDLKIMIIEYCNQGSLSNKIQLQKKIPEDQAISILKQILNGIGECHKQKIIHRDLKPDNILIHNGEMKIADFGFSKKLSIQNQSDSTKNTILGTPITMAPQILEKKPYGLKADIWSIGIIFFWMIFGVCPFKANSKNQEILKDINEKLSNSFEQFNGVKPSQKVKKFLEQVLVIDVERRLGWKQVKNHEIFTTDYKSLPNGFYRQTQIQKNDQQLFQLERQFIDMNQSFMVSQRTSQFSQSSKSISETLGNESILLKKEQSKESFSNNFFVSQASDIIKFHRQTSQFQELGETSLQTPQIQERNYSLNERKIKDEIFSDLKNQTKKSFEKDRRQINPQLPPRKYLQDFHEESPEKQKKLTEEKKKPHFRSLRIQQSQNQKKRNRLPIVFKKKESNEKSLQKESGAAILRTEQTLANQNKQYKHQNTGFLDIIHTERVQSKPKQSQLPFQIQNEIPRRQPQMLDQLREKIEMNEPQLPHRANQKILSKQPQMPFKLRNALGEKPQSASKEGNDISKNEFSSPFKVGRKVNQAKKLQVDKPKKGVKAPQDCTKKEKNQYESMTNSQVITMDKLINRQEDELYIWARKIHVQCLKTEVIFNNIVKVIEKYNLLKANDRKVIEIMFLLCSRCRNNISPIYVQYEKRKHSTVLKQISVLVERLYKQVTEKYYHYSGLLTNKENQRIAIVKDWFSKRVFTTDFNKRNMFLTGVESMAEFRSSVDFNRMNRSEPEEQEDVVLMDYNKQDQIMYTSACLKEFIKDLTRHEKAKEVVPYMLHFQQICRIKVNDSTIYSFKDTVQFIIKDRSYQQKNFK